jgi:flavorubredoxin
MSQTTVPNPTRVDEIADGIYRLATAIDLPDGPGAFSFNQYLIDDDEPLLFHTGPRNLFPLVRQGVEEIMPLSRLRFIAFSGSARGL